MRLNSKTRYGFLAMLDLALNYGAGPINVSNIASRQQLPVKYLEHVLALLRNSGLVRGIRGARGGHTLAKAPDEITLREIFDVLEGSEGFVQCTSDPQGCDRYEVCVIQEVWAQMYEACAEVLGSITLGDLADRARQKRGALVSMYHI